MTSLKRLIENEWDEQLDPRWQYEQEQSFELTPWEALNAARSKEEKLIETLRQEHRWESELEIEGWEAMIAFLGCISPGRWAGQPWVRLMENHRPVHPDDLVKGLPSLEECGLLHVDYVDGEKKDRKAVYFCTQKLIDMLRA